MGQCHDLVHCISYFSSKKTTFAKPNMLNSSFNGRKLGTCLFFHVKDTRNKAHQTSNSAIFWVNEASS